MKYLLSGWIGHANLGDDLLLFCTVSGLRANDNNAQIVVLSHRAQTTNDLLERWGLHNVVVVQRLTGKINWRCQLWWLAKWSDFYVVAGGTAIRDFSMAPNSVIQQYKMARIAQFAGSQIEFIGLGAGPIWRKRSKRVIDKLFRFATGAIRDSSSYDLLLQHGAIKVTQTADLVFSMLPIKNMKHNTVRRVAIVLRRWENTINHEMNSYCPDWGNLIQALCEYYPDVKVSLFCMQANANSLDDDLGLAQSIVKTTNNRVDIVKLFDCSLDKLKHHFASVDLVISMRLHGLIIGALSGCRLIGIEYDPKIAGLLKDLGLQEYSVKYADDMIENLKQLFNKVEAQRYCVQRLHEKALMNFNFITMGS